jgi:AcrR family transcriptional regulator
MPARANEPQPFERLPSGRHGLTRETVLASQRGRLLDAMVQIVTEKGYADTTVSDVVERAGVSRRTFYELFDDKEACFLASYETGVEIMLGRLRSAIRSVPRADWRARARAAVTTYMDVLAEEPNFAWALHVSIVGAGPAALARRAQMLGLFGEIWGRLHAVARAEDPLRPELSAAALRAMAGGMEELVRERLRTHGARSLPGYVEDVLRAALQLLGDAD